MRWKNRPAGSNWGEFGADDQRGRMNLVTREKVLQGMREVKEGIAFCLFIARGTDTKEAKGSTGAGHFA